VADSFEYKNVVSPSVFEFMRKRQNHIAQKEHIMNNYYQRAVSSKISYSLLTLNIAKNKSLSKKFLKLKYSQNPIGDNRKSSSLERKMRWKKKNKLNLKTSNSFSQITPYKQSFEIRGSQCTERDIRGEGTSPVVHDLDPNFSFA